PAGGGGAGGRGGGGDGPAVAAAQPGPDPHREVVVEGEGETPGAGGADGAALVRGRGHCAQGGNAQGYPGLVPFLRLVPSANVNRSRSSILSPVRPVRCYPGKR